MKTFKEFLDESSLTRLASKAKKGAVAIVSAERGGKSKAENKARSKQLEKDIRGAGLPGPTKVKGRYTEHGKKPKAERSYVVSQGKKGKKKFKKALEKLATKYDQDSVLIQRKGGGEATLKGTNKAPWPGKGKNVKTGKMRPGRTGEFDTQIKKKTFTYERN
jgi:hypothetical protein